MLSEAEAPPPGCAKSGPSLAFNGQAPSRRRLYLPISPCISLYLPGTVQKAHEEYGADYTRVLDISRISILCPSLKVLCDYDSPSPSPNPNP